MRTYRIHLIRHGLTDANRYGIYCGSTDLPLNEEGIAGIKKLTAGCSYPYAEWVFSSPLARAVETAKLIYPLSDITEVENLREMSFGEFEGKSMKELAGNPLFAGFISGDKESLPAGAEAPDRFAARSAGALISIVNLMMKSGVYSAAIVTHAGVIGSILSALAYPRAMPYEWNPPPGSGYTAVADPTLFLREPVLEVVRTIPVYDANDDSDG